MADPPLDHATTPDAGHVPLWCKSNLSFLEGASHPEELVERAAELGLGALALTDRDGVHGLPRAWVRGRELGVRTIAGAQVTVEGDRRLVLLAASRAGYGELCRLLTRGRRRCPKGSSLVTVEEVCAHARGVVALWGASRRQGRDELALARALREAFEDRLYALVARHRLPEDGALEAWVRRCARRLGVPVVAATEVLYHTPARRALQDVLACIRAGVPLDGAGRVIRANASHALLGSRAFARLFEDDPGAVARTLEIAERCTFTLDELRYRYPSERLPDGRTSAEHLRALTLEGARRRFGGAVPEDIRRRIEAELALVEELDYPGYFLTMHEIVAFCRERGILCQGRGSAANSVVCFCLGITAVDPTRIDLLFERFLSRERREPPDIDLDIEHERREEVIQHVYERYGRRHAAMVASVIRYRTRSAVRDVGKVLGLPETALDRLAKLVSHHDADLAGALREAGLDPRAPRTALLLALVEEILDFPRHLSIHPGGFLLGHEPVDTIVPIENGAMEGRTVIQWDKDDLEALGLFKVDLLGLGALTLVHRAFDLLRAHRGLDLDLASLPEDDPETFEMLCRADTVGVFQVESRAQMAMLPRLRPRCFYDLVIEISIVRPGPIAGDMVHPYLRRRHGEEEVVYPHPCLEPVLRKTLGVPLFQEQVIRLAMVAADYSPGEADQLRRDMAAWRRTGRIERHRRRLISRMLAKGIEETFAERVFEQIRGFGEYGFPESHAASFALIAYATAWLKRHHPDVFACALLNAWPMGFYAPATIVEDARRHGVPVLAVDVQRSDYECTLEPVEGERLLGLRMGLRWVRGLPEQEARRLAEEARRRPFEDLDDLARRTGLGRRSLETLARAGALAALEDDRRRALWRVAPLARPPRDLLPLAEPDPTPRFRPLDRLETLAWDHETTAHSPSAHPLEPLREALAAQGLIDAATLRALPDGAFARHAGLVICRQRPGTARGVVFLTLEDETGFANVVVWQRTYERFAATIKTAPFLAVAGKVQRQHDVVHVIAERFWTPRLEQTPVARASRDFR